MRIVISSAMDLKHWINVLEKYDKSYVIISISEPGERKKESTVTKSLEFIDEDCQGVLELNFYDIDQDLGSYKCITVEDAIKAVDFAIEHENVDYLICQCAAGISRSSGMAASLLEVLGMNSNEVFMNPKYIPNKKVYRTVKKVGCYSD